LIFILSMDGKPFARSSLAVFPVRRFSFVIKLLLMTFAVVFPARLTV